MKGIRVPGSSANLGPGFDTLGLALGVYLQCQWEPNDQLEIHVGGRDVECIPADESNLIWRTIAQYAPSPLRLRIHNDIPLGKGLGSSAAALMAGIAIGNPGWSREQVMNECARLEGHPDNAAASALGGIVASSTSNGVTEAVRIPLPPNVSVGVVVPDFALPTAKARAALPECYNRADTVFNLQRTALLVAALATGNQRALSAALDDALHQPYRASLVPGLKEILALRAPGLLGCVLSGAGPSVLVFFEAGCSPCCELVRHTFLAHGPKAEVLLMPVAEGGYQWVD